MLPARDEHGPQLMYREQLDTTARLARQVQEEKDRLETAYRQGHPEVDKETEDAELEKLKFISGQVAAAQQIVNMLVANDAFHTSKDFIRAPSPEELAMRNRFYQEVYHLLVTIEQSFRVVLCLDTLSFKRVFANFRSFMEEHPAFTKVLGGGGIVLGGLAGAGVHGLIWSHGILGLGLHRPLNLAFGRVGAVTVGGAAGALSGLVLGFAMLELLSLFWHAGVDSSAVQKDERKELREELQRTMEALQQKGLTVDSIIELTTLFQEYFNVPMLRALDGDCCPICLEGFPASGGNSREQVTKAPNCAGNHLVHRECYLKWVGRSGSDACVICRQ